MSGHNNPPQRLVEMDDDLAAFVVENCETNMRFALMNLQGVSSRDLQEKLVEMIENFKKLKAAVEKSK